MTYRPTNLLIAGLALLTIVFAVVILALLISRPVEAQTTTPPAQTTNITAPRQITVVGSGTVSGQPDTATVQIGVETQAATAREALDQNNTQAAAIRSRLAELGIAAEDIQTSGFSISPQQSNDNPSTVTGYYVRNMVSVTIRNISQAGQLLDQVVDSGANSIYGISFAIEDQTALVEQARTDAIADARVRAEQYAKAIGANVGEVLLISENTSAQPYPVMARGAVAEASVPIEAGQQQVFATAQVTFALQ